MLILKRVCYKVYINTSKLWRCFDWNSYKQALKNAYANEPERCFGNNDPDKFEREVTFIILKKRIVTMLILKTKKEASTKSYETNPKTKGSLKKKTCKSVEEPLKMTILSTEKKYVERKENNMSYMSGHPSKVLCRRPSVSSCTILRLLVKLCLTLKLCKHLILKS